MAQPWLTWLTRITTEILVWCLWTQALIYHSVCVEGRDNFRICALSFDHGFQERSNPGCKTFVASDCSHWVTHQGSTWILSRNWSHSLNSGFYSSSAHAFALWQLEFECWGFVVWRIFDPQDELTYMMHIHTHKHTLVCPHRSQGSGVIIKSLSGWFWSFGPTHGLGSEHFVHNKNWGVSKSRDIFQNMLSGTREASFGASVPDLLTK